MNSCNQDLRSHRRCCSLWPAHVAEDYWTRQTSCLVPKCSAKGLEGVLLSACRAKPCADFRRCSSLASVTTSVGRCGLRIFCCAMLPSSWLRWYMSQRRLPWCITWWQEVRQKCSRSCAATQRRQPVRRSVLGNDSASGEVIDG